MTKKFYTVLTLLVCVFILSACSPNGTPQVSSPNSQSNNLSTTPSSVVENPSVGTNAEPEKIVIYNKGRSTTLEKGTEPYESIKNYIYKMINEKSNNNQIKLIITNETIEGFKQQQGTVEFVYLNHPVEFEFPDKTKKVITQFLIASAAQSHVVITSSQLEKGPYLSNGQFMVQLDSTYEDLLKKNAQ